MRGVVVCLVIAMCTSVAAAQPGMTAPAPAKQVRKKEPLVGTLLAIAGTSAPIVVVAATRNNVGNDPANAVLLAGATAMLLPSAGHWYAGTFFTPGMAIRLVGGGVATLGIFSIVASDGSAASEQLGTAITIGLVGLGVGAIWDIATANLAVEEWNAKQVEIAPAVLKTGDGYGVGLAGRF